jgi:AcrR family transcriptional regulator
MKNSKTPSTESAPRKRGRPKGPTAEGLATREQLYTTAIQMIAARGYEATTLRDIAKKARVSVGLLYRYFPSKRAIVLELYDQLSAKYAVRAAKMGRGTWRDRFQFALTTSLKVLEPHRQTLAALVPVLFGSGSDALFAPATQVSRERVRSVFGDAVCGATDAPESEDAAALGRLLYMAHLGVILWWLLDRSPRQRATSELVAMFERMGPMVTFALGLEPARALVRVADSLIREGLFGDGQHKK